MRAGQASTRGRQRGEPQGGESPGGPGGARRRNPHASFQSVGGMKPLERGPARESERKPIARGEADVERRPDLRRMKPWREEPRERAWWRHRGDRGGSNASRPAGTAGTQLDLEEATSGSGGSSRNGCAVGDTNLGRAVHRSTVRASPGQTLERGESLREAGRLIRRTPRPGPGSRKVGGTTKRPRQTDMAPGPGDGSGRPTNRKRGIHRAAMRRVITRMTPERSEEEHGGPPSVSAQVEQKASGERKFHRCPELAEALTRPFGTVRTQSQASR
jgi:hypothetical protein